jgi:hypothetical protein
MNGFLNALAVIAAAAAALVTALAGAWRDLPVVTLSMRCLVVAILVFGFLRAGGELAGRSLLRGLAERQVDGEKSEADAGHAEHTGRNRHAA